MEHCLDVSGLEPPEPLEQILDALADLAESDWLRVKHRREPYPLYGMLRNMGYLWCTRAHDVDGIEMMIWSEHQSPPQGWG
jgi:hypothetical protein